MSTLAARARAVEIGFRTASALAFLPPLLTRLVVGQAFFHAGRGKLASFDGTVEFFASLGIPAPEWNAAVVARLEYYGGMLLVAGLLTRIVALLLSSTMVVALLTADRAVLLEALKGSSEAGLTDLPALVFLLFMIWLVISGPGTVSVDHVLFRRWRPEELQRPGPA